MSGKPGFLECKTKEVPIFIFSFYSLHSRDHLLRFDLFHKVHKVELQ